MNRRLNLVLLAAFGASSSFGAIRAVTPQIPDADWTKDWWMPRHEEKMAAVTNGGAKVVFLGDSISHFWEDKDRGLTQGEKYFSEGDLKMLDLGFSGDRTEHVLWRLRHGELDGYSAKVVFLMIGTNNAGHFPVEKEPPIDTILGVREILKVVREKQPGAKIVLTAIFPRGADATDEVRRRNEIVNKEISKFADGKDIFWLDFTDRLMTLDGRLSPEIFSDLLHPGPLGYEIWASEALPYARAALAGTPLPPNRWPAFIRPEAFRMEGPAATYPATRIRSGGFGSEDWWTDRLLEKRNQIVDSNGEFDLVFFGDSITHFWETNGKEAFAELRRTYSVLDIGYSSDRTENLLWRGENGELDGYKAKCVMLMIGTNNTWHRMDKPEEIAAGIRKILDLIVRKQPQAKVLLLPIFPFGNEPQHKIRVNNEKVNAIIRDYADGRRILWVDFNEKLVDEKGDTAKWTIDGCHPNAAGYAEVWLPAVLPYFKEIIGK